MSSVIHKIQFSNDVFPVGAYLHISDTEVDIVNMESLVNEGRIVFNNVQAVADINRYNFDSHNFQRTKNLNVSNWVTIYRDFFQERESKFSIINSDLGNTQFIGCDLASFSIFEFKNSKIADVFLADTVIPQRKEITTDEPFTRPEQLSQQRLVLNQFKKIYERQGDVVRATELRGQELEAHSRFLVNTGFFKNIIELFNLWLNKLSGNYGNNWLWAAFSALIVNWLFFWWYSNELGYTLGDIGNFENRETFWKLFSYSFEFLNPIRKHSTLTPEKDITPFARIIDYIGRIFIAYFVYQTIQAFRKFGRRSA